MCELLDVSGRSGQVIYGIISRSCVADVVKKSLNKLLSFKKVLSLLRYSIIVNKKYSEDNIVFEQLFVFTTSYTCKVRYRDKC